MQPLTITAHIAGSIAIARPEDIALDGILAAQVLRRHFREDFYFLPDPKELLFFARLPLEMRGVPSERVQMLQTGDVWMQPVQQMADESLWYWSCSSAQIDVKGHDTQYWNKRFDTQASLSDHIDFGGRVEKIIIEQGRYKSYHMPLPTLVTDRIVWYAYGDWASIADLLAPIAGIGKKRVQGNGHVLRWQVEPVQEDYSTWCDDRLMRPLPGPLVRDIEWAEPFDMLHIAYRAPQWHPANQALCVVGGKRHGG
jgi:CRISPR type IV-associated protein Csf3